MCVFGEGAKWGLIITSTVFFGLLILYCDLYAYFTCKRQYIDHVANIDEVTNQKTKESATVSRDFELPRLNTINTPRLEFVVV